jgi:hypothetical protein
VRAGSKNAVGHTVASLTSRRRGYATLLLLKVFLTGPHGLRQQQLVALQPVVEGR